MQRLQNVGVNSDVYFWAIKFQVLKKEYKNEIQAKKAL